MAQPYTLPICKKFKTEGLGAVDLEKQTGWAKKLKNGSQGEGAEVEKLKKQKGQGSDIKMNRIFIQKVGEFRKRLRLIFFWLKV